ncbi:MAG: hypothetical protein PVI21_02590 [Candidatus Woesebacteria bacterium]|jgi:hypothetical protein
MLANNLKAIAKDKCILACLATLLAGQVLYFFDVRFLFVIGVILVLAYGLPYPRVIQSIFARFIFAILIAFSFFQVAAAVQFFVAPQSDFKILSLISTFLILLTMAFLGNSRDKSARFLNGKDLGAIMTALFFVVPFMLFTIWGDDLARITSFGALQSPDGSAHNSMLSEMHHNQHLTYGKNGYYPKGFHIAQTVFMDAFNVHQSDLDWAGCARLFIAQYIVWGFILAYVLYYAGQKLFELVKIKAKNNNNIMLSLLIGPSLSVFYLFLYAQQGFLNYYYICAVFVASLLFLSGLKLKTSKDCWFAVAYMAFGFSVAMSWGPTALPLFVAIPGLYLIYNFKKLGDVKKLLDKKYLPVYVGFLSFLVPLYFHFKYYEINQFTNGGSITVFNGAFVLAGLLLLIYVVVIGRVSDSLRRFMVCVLLPSFLLVGGLAAVHLFMVGEVRYYAIKTSYMLELVLLVIFAVLFIKIISKTRLKEMVKWLFAPTVFGLLIFLLLAISGNPLMSERAMTGGPAFYREDIQKMVDLGTTNRIRSYNVVVLHYDFSEKRVFGSQLLPSWAGNVSQNLDVVGGSLAYSSKIYGLMTYGTGSKTEQQEVVEAVKKCSEEYAKDGRKYYVITDPASEEYFKGVLGKAVTFL